MAIVAHTRPFVIGVDTHSRNHSYAILTAATGEQVASKQFPTTPAGLNRAVDWASRLIGGDLVTLWVIEGAATYGARLARLVTDTGLRPALRILTSARESMSTERTASVNALTALLRTADLGLDARKPLTTGQITEAASWRTRAEDLGLAAARAEARRLAKRVRALDIELVDNRSQLEELLRQSKAAPLLDMVGVGPVTAAVAYSAWSHRGR